MVIKMKEYLVKNIYETLVANIDKLDKVSMIANNKTDMIEIKQTNNKIIRIKFEEENM